MTAELLIEPLSLTREGATGLIERSVRSEAPSALLGPEPPPTDRAVVDQALARLDGSPYPVSAWTAKNRQGEVVAVVGATLETCTPDDEQYTYSRPAVATITVSTWHVESAEAGAAALPRLLERIESDARALGITHVSVQVRAGDWIGESIWLALGFREEQIFAGRGTAASVSRRAKPGLVVRPASAVDSDALAALAREEILHHALNTANGTAPDQSAETIRRSVEESLEAAAGGNSAVFIAGRVGIALGSTHLSILEAAEWSPGLLYLPRRYGYIGLTSVTASARGSGVGSALTEAAVTFLRDRGVEHVFLHFASDNVLSRSFWTTRGFAPVITTFTRAVGVPS